MFSSRQNVLIQNYVIRTISADALLRYPAISIGVEKDTASLHDEGGGILKLGQNCFSKKNTIQEGYIFNVVSF